MANGNWETVHKKLEGYLGHNGPNVLFSKEEKFRKKYGSDTKIARILQGPILPLPYCKEKFTIWYHQKNLH